MYNYRRKELNKRPPARNLHGNAVAEICVYLAAAERPSLKAGSDWRLDDERRKERFENCRHDFPGGVCLLSSSAPRAEGDFWSCGNRDRHYCPLDRLGGAVN